MNILFIVKAKILEVIEWVLLIMSIIVVSIRVNKLWAHRPKLFQHMSFWWPFLNPHLTIHHSYIGVRLRWDNKSYISI